MKKLIVVFTMLIVLTGCSFNEEKPVLSNEELAEVILNSYDFQSYYDARMHNLSGVVKINFYEDVEAIRNLTDQNRKDWERLAIKYQINYSTEDQLLEKIVQVTQSDFSVTTETIHNVVSDLFELSTQEDVFELGNPNERQCCISGTLILAALPIVQCVIRCEKQSESYESWDTTGKTNFIAGCTQGCVNYDNIIKGK